ncbi:aryldialkylphosphatase [Mycolicibacterium helvum]|uniref:Aryldialkylphosphatase n=2 Tax=Mycolicibacterium helvum TaxID=1534349 RepID=A0A7I7TCT9_9MYCO|nr:aryldialkylphosphatase [Mycolicibacterium helvum]
MHEHLFSDARVWYSAPPDRCDPVAVTMDNLGWLRWHIHGSEDNLVLDDPAVTETELYDFAQAGGQTLVDLTPVNLGRRVSDLPALARRTGVNIVVSTGIYVHDAHPQWVESADVDAVADFFLTELRDGIEGTGIRPAIIGEIGTSATITDREWRVVRAAGAAGAATGTAVNIHLDPFGTHALSILDVLLSEGMTASRVVFSHMDEHLDLPYHRDVAASGAILEYDTFGAEFYWGDFHRDATDQQRLADLTTLIGEGFGEQLVLGCDVWMKINQRHYGGLGYGHLPRTIMPLLRDHYGVDPETITTMFVKTPASLLTRP